MKTEIPKNLDEAIDWIISKVGGIELALEHETEDSFIARSHDSYGMWIRNKWGFWAESSELYFSFLSLGIRHPDDMSGIIITSAYRKFHNQDIRLEEQVQDYINFWYRAGERYPKEPGT